MKTLSFTFSFLAALVLLLCASFLLFPVSAHALSMVAPNPTYYNGNYYNNAWQCPGSCYWDGQQQYYYSQEYNYPQQYYYEQQYAYYYPEYYPVYYPEYYPVYYYQAPSYQYPYYYW